MKAQFVRNAQRLQTLLLAKGYKTRAEVLAAFDAKGKGSIGLKGIGPALSKQLALMLDSEAYGPIEWDALMPLIPWTLADAGAEEGHTLSPAERIDLVAEPNDDGSDGDQDAGDESQGVILPPQSPPTAV